MKWEWVLILYRQKNMKGNFENVGYAKVDKAGIYNILIMEEKQPIIALGAGASTKFVFDDGARIERVENVKDVTNYISSIDEMIERKKKWIKEISGYRMCEDDLEAVQKTAAGLTPLMDLIRLTLIMNSIMEYR